MTVSFRSGADSEPGKGAFLGVIELCYFGRFIFGCGGETLSVAQKGFIAQWFDQKSLNFVLGLQLSFARIGEYKLIFILNPYWQIQIFSRNISLLGRCTGRFLKNSSNFFEILNSGA